MISWHRRPVEIANLLNPAFCGEIIRRSAQAYQEISSKAFPYPLAFLILPIVLHKRTRELIAMKRRKLLHVWLEDNPEVKIGFAERAAEFVPLTKEALIFMLQMNVMTIETNAMLKILPFKKVTVQGLENQEIADCYRQAEFVGRWFARGGTIETIYIMWGVRP
jgi:hypothetical protein